METQNNARYFALTIGPIYKTIGKAEKTRELWAASYLFAWLCRRLLEKMMSKEVGVTDAQILLPSPKGLAYVSGDIKPGVGMFPDRIMFTASDTQDLAWLLKKVIQPVKKELALLILEGIEQYGGFDPYARLFQNEILKDQKKNSSGETALQYIEKYFQVYALEADAAKHLNFTEKDEKTGVTKPLGIVKSLNLLLDHQELRSSIAHFDPDPIKVFLRAVNHTWLRKDAMKRDHFDSLPEIATVELRSVGNYEFQKKYDELVKTHLDEAKRQERTRTQAEKYGDQLPEDVDESNLHEEILTLSGIEKYRRTYHRYVAIVHADGDNMGKLIGTLKTDADIQDFSSDLLLFVRKANNILAGEKYTNNDHKKWGYGAAPVYIGGDELVFFAPVATRTQEGELITIFHIIEELDQALNDIFNKKDAESGQYLKYPDTESRPSLTYGLSITYIKHPMQEAFNVSHKLMIKAKNDENYKTRNRLNFKVQKHSGQIFGGVLNKNFPQLYKAILKLFEDKANDLSGDDAEKFVNSISKALRRDESILFSLADKGISFHPYFDNNFNESIHDRFRMAYLSPLADLLESMLVEALKSLKKDNEGNMIPWSKLERETIITETLSTFHGLLRMLHFMRDDEFRHLPSSIKPIDYEQPV